MKKVLLVVVLLGILAGALCYTDISVRNEAENYKRQCYDKRESLVYSYEVERNGFADYMVIGKCGDPHLVDDTEKPIMTAHFYKFKSQSFQAGE